MKNSFLMSGMAGGALLAALAIASQAHAQTTAAPAAATAPVTAPATSPVTTGTPMTTAPGVTAHTPAAALRHSYKHAHHRVAAPDANPNGTDVANGRTGGQPMSNEPLPAQPQAQPTPSQ